MVNGSRGQSRLAPRHATKLAFGNLTLMVMAMVLMMSPQDIQPEDNNEKITMIDVYENDNGDYDDGVVITWQNDYSLS